MLAEGLATPGHRRRHEAGLQPAHRPAGPGRHGGPGRLPGRDGRITSPSSATASTAPARCCARWWPPVAWAARRSGLPVLTPSAVAAASSFPQSAARCGDAPGAVAIAREFWFFF